MDDQPLLFACKIMANSSYLRNTIYSDIGQSEQFVLYSPKLKIDTLKRILITGAAGFLGSHLCDRFIKEDYHVIGMDNLITGDMKNIQHLFDKADFEFYHHDVTTFVHVPGKIDYILHFASPASPIDYLKIPIETL